MERQRRQRHKAYARHVRTPRRRLCLRKTGMRLLKKAFCKTHAFKDPDMTDSHIAIDAKRATGG